MSYYHAYYRTHVNKRFYIPYAQLRTPEAETSVWRAIRVDPTRQEPNTGPLSLRPSSLLDLLQLAPILYFTSFFFLLSLVFFHLCCTALCCKLVYTQLRFGLLNSATPHTSARVSPSPHLSGPRVNRPWAAHLPGLCFRAASTCASTFRPCRRCRRPWRRRRRGCHPHRRPHRRHPRRRRSAS